MGQREHRDRLSVLRHEKYCWSRYFVSHLCHHIRHRRLSSPRFWHAHRRSTNNMGVDWDDLFAYKTESKVRIRSRWLGGLYYISMIAIFAAYLPYELVYNHGYGVKHELTGSLRATVKSNESISELSSQTYCQQASAPTPPLKVLPCMNSDDLLTTATGRKSLLVGTRLTTIAESRDESCSEFDITSGCEPWTETGRTAAFIYDVASSTINVQHAVAPAFEESIGRDVVDTFKVGRPDPKLFGKGGEAKALACTGKGRSASFAGLESEAARQDQTS